MSTRPSLRKAVDAFCRRCTYAPGGGRGRWLQQIAACTATACPLHPVRHGANRAKTGRLDAQDARSPSTPDPSSAPDEIAPRAAVTGAGR